MQNALVQNAAMVTAALRDGALQDAAAQDATRAIETYLWAGLVGALFLLLVTAFGYLLVLRRQQWLVARFEHDVIVSVDDWLSKHTPDFWYWVKRRFSLQAWHGLLLTFSVTVVLVMAVAFLAIATSWIDREYLYRIDVRVNQAAVSTFSGELRGLLGFVTHFADNETSIALIAVLAVWFIVRRERWHLLALAILEGVGAPFLLLLKWIFQRIRPDSPYVYAAGYSFPSGHAFTGMVLYGFLVFLTWRYSRRHAVRIPVTIALIMIILMIALSRVVLSVHWASDVLGGLVIGLAWLIASLMITRAVRDTFEPGAPI